MLGDAIHVLAALGTRLARNGSPYATAFTVLLTLTDTQPQPQDDPPVRTMDEALETFGPGADGVEPLPGGGPQAAWSCGNAGGGEHVATIQFATKPAPTVAANVSA